MGSGRLQTDVGTLEKRGDADRSQGGFLRPVGLEGGPEPRPEASQASMKTSQNCPFFSSSFQRPLLTYPPTSNRIDFREKMFVSKFVIPTGNFLYGKRA